MWSHAADLRTLARLIPAESRLVIDPGAAPAKAAAAATEGAQSGKALELVRMPAPHLHCMSH
jgi:hypothetical protein